MEAKTELKRKEVSPESVSLYITDVLKSTDVQFAAHIIRVKNGKKQFTYTKVEVNSSRVTGVPGVNFKLNHV